MNAHTLIVAALVSLLVIAGTAQATPGSHSGQATADEHGQAASHSQNGDHPTAEKNEASAENKATGENETAEIARQQTSTESMRSQHAHEKSPLDRPERAGPPTALPGGVPDFVSDLHRLIRSFLDGGLDGHLGPVIPGTLPTGAA